MVMEVFFCLVHQYEWRLLYELSNEDEKLRIAENFKTLRLYDFDIRATGKKQRHISYFEEAGSSILPDELFMCS